VNTRLAILDEVNDERERQDRLKAAGKFAKTCADAMSNEKRLAVLAEEFGEVAREVCDQRPAEPPPDNLRVELIQVAAVCLAWIEGLDEDARWDDRE
jgi:NTP pyrophosphatase (non-canonical NTP hydrolase)